MDDYLVTVAWSWSGMNDIVGYVSKCAFTL